MWYGKTWEYVQSSRCMQNTEMVCATRWHDFPTYTCRRTMETVTPMLGDRRPPSTSTPNWSASSCAVCWARPRSIGWRPGYGHQEWHHHAIHHTRIFDWCRFSNVEYVRIGTIDRLIWCIVTIITVAIFIPFNWLNGGNGDWMIKFICHIMTRNVPIGIVKLWIDQIHYNVNLLCEARFILTVIEMIVRFLFTKMERRNLSDRK